MEIMFQCLVDGDGAGLVEDFSSSNKKNSRSGDKPNDKDLDAVMNQSFA